MKNKNERISGFGKKLRVILTCCLIFGGLLIASLITSIFKEGGLSNYEIFTRAETVYVILIFAVSLPILLLCMIGSVIKRKRGSEFLPEYICDLAKSVLDEVEHEPEGENLIDLSDKPDEDGENGSPEGEDSAEGADGEQTDEVTDEPEEAPKEEPKEETKKKPTNREPRFCMLNETDRRMANRGVIHYAGAKDLATLCESFRRFCAARMKLYYDIEDIRRFISSLTVTKLIVMQGMSGTGKTSLSYAFGEFLENPSVIVPIQPMWKERSDLIGYFNEFTGRFNETTLLQKMYEANYSKSIYVTVLDEMNIARVEYYFAEFLSLLEIPDPDKRYLDVVSDIWDNDPVMLRDGKVRLPENMWFMGTVNNDDSTFAISDKVYDRAMVMNLDKKCEPFECEDHKPVRVSAAQLEELAREARVKYAISDRNMRRIRKLDKYLIGKFRITFGNRIMKQLTGYVPVYIACGGKETDAIDDMLSKKVFRKLDSQNPVYVKSVAEDVCDYLDELFGKDAMPLCKEYIRRPR